MKRVDEHIAKSKLEFKNILSLEQDNIDTLSGQIIKSNISKDAQTIEEAYGLNITPVTKKEEVYLKSLMKDSKDRYLQAFKVINNSTQNSLDNFVKNRSNKSKLDLFHGSRNQNWWSIANNGLLIRPTNAIHTGSMWSDGIYMANKARKSIGYCSSKNSYWANGTDDFGLLAVYDVHVGKQKEYSRRESWHGRDLSEKFLQNLGGFDSVYAKAGVSLMNDELIVYNSNQTSIKYLIKFK